MPASIYYNYMCEEAHTWVVRRLEGEPERPADTVCPYGHVAVTCGREAPADRVHLIIESAARIVDSAKDLIHFDGLYWLVLKTPGGDELRRSTDMYPWSRAVQIMGRFAGKTVENAVRWWDRKAP